MAGQSQPDATATGDVLATTTKNDDATQEIRTNLSTGFLAHETLQYEFTPAAALDTELKLGLLADYPEFDVDIDWENFYNNPSPARNVNAPEAPQEFNDFNDEARAEQAMDKMLSVLATQPESNSLPGFPYDLNDEAPAEQPLGKPLSASATQPEDFSSPGLPNTHYVSPLPQTQFTSAQEPKSASQDDTVDPAVLLATAVEDSSDLFGISDSSGGRDLNEFSPGYFELPDSPSGLDFLQSLQLIGREIQSAMSADVGYSTQQLPHTTGNSAIQGYGSPSASRVVLAGSSDQNPTSESRAVLTNTRRLSKGYQGGATQRQPDRSRIQRKYIPNSAYTPLNQAPEKWDIFEYTKDGELEPSRVFSAEEINRFLFNHPLHQGHRNLKKSQLKLRVHKTPASSAKRFPNKLKCRFKECPMAMRTINQGQLLVIVDELSVQHPNHDLFLNAGYFHLCCIERYCNFPEICSKLNVSAEGRAAGKEDRGINRFALSGEEEKIVEDFVEACCANAGNLWVAHCPDQQTNGQTNGCPHFDQPSLQYRGTLSHQLFITKLHYGGQGRINLRKDREERAGYGGANITRHLGELSKEAELREYSRSHKNQNQLKPTKTGRCYRADRDAMKEVVEEEEEQPGYDTQLPANASATTGSQPYQAHGTKRNRDESEDGQTLDHEIVQANKKPRHGPELKPLEWNSDRSSRVGFGNQKFENTVEFDGDYHVQDFCIAGTPGTSPRTTLTPKSRRTRPQLSITTTGPPQDGRSTSTNGRRSRISEDESEGEIKLELLAAQTRRRALEIENAKATEDALEFKLEKINKKKRAREEADDDGDGSGSRGKRQRA